MKSWQYFNHERVPSVSSGDRHHLDTKHHFEVLDLNLPSAAVLKSLCYPAGGADDP